MKLNSARRQKVRVHELARELGWAPLHLLEELSRRGELVKSAASTLEAPIVRAIRRDFAAVSEGSDLDATVTPEVYDKSAESHATEESDDSFAAAPSEIPMLADPTDDQRRAFTLIGAPMPLTAA
jgi:hypothetical protein